jgi:glycosyltransferase involved in cell wall biosynthesis
MDLLVVPSLSDPFPMIILESMSAGLPVVAHSVDGIPELIADGRTGWLVSPEERKQMVSTILWAEENPSQRSQVAQAAQRTIRAHSPSAYAEKFVTILRSRASCYKESEAVGS